MFFAFFGCVFAFWGGVFVFGGAFRAVRLFISRLFSLFSFFAVELSKTGITALARAVFNAAMRLGGLAGCQLTGPVAEGDFDVFG